VPCERRGRSLLKGIEFEPSGWFGHIRSHLWLIMGKDDLEAWGGAWPTVMSSLPVRADLARAG
jgi:hypothetical protein